MAHWATLGNWPSYQNDFYAPGRLFLPRYPSLWHGCVGAWCPSLGPTGTRLIDWSGRNRHGIITNAALATSWALSVGKSILTLDGTNDYVTSAAPDLPAMALGTVALWVSRSTNSTMVIACTNLGSNGFGFYHASSGLFFDTVTTSGRVGARYASGLTAGTLTHIAGVYDGATLSIYVDGRPVALASGGTQTGTVNALKTSIGGTPTGGSVLTGSVDDLRVYNRVLTPFEISLLATRRGIAYEYDDDLPYSEQGTAGALLTRLMSEGLFVGSSP